MADVVAGGVLGAVVLAVVLLAIEQRRQHRLITQLRAQMAAEEIVRMTRAATPGHGKAPPEATGGLPS